MRGTLVSFLCERAREDKNLVLITADLGFGALEPFMNEFPDQFINCGIAEQNMILVAAGMALQGKHVVCYSISNFPTMRCLEQIRNDLAYPGLPVIIACVGTGVEYGTLGMSHHTTEDIAVMRSLPNVSVFTPCNKQEVRSALEQAFDAPGPSYIRMNKAGAETGECLSSDGSLNKYREGSGTAVISCGEIISEALKIADENPGTISVYNMMRIKPIDVKKLSEIVSEYKNIVTLEEHNLDGGMGSAIAEVFSDLKLNVNLKRIGIENRYTSKVGKREDLRKYYGIDSESVRKTIREISER
jgi:transketolase